MSGVITGPHFKAAFHNPTRYEIGTMVAILEIGAFSEWKQEHVDGPRCHLLLSCMSDRNTPLAVHTQ